jgi:predicted AlkP superfamily pyrophosphatase or phosphodiesterase
MASLCAAAAQAGATKPAVGSGYEHVLLISVDGMHSIDLANWVQNHPDSNFAKLAGTGITYPNAFTTAPSDSYPGMIAQVTGASPKTAGLFYDDSYDRTGQHAAQTDPRRM